MIKKSTCGTVLLFGPSNSGKSSLLNILIGEKISTSTHKLNTTRKEIKGVLTKDFNQIILVDVPGIMNSDSFLQKLINKQIKNRLNNVDIILLVIDVTKNSKIEFISLKKLSDIVNVPVFLILNKIDILKNKDDILHVIELWRKKYNFAGILPLSVHKKLGIRNLIDSIIKKLPESPFLFNPNEITDSSEKKIISEFIREKIILELSQEIPHKIVVVINKFDETLRMNLKKAIIFIDAVIYVERKSQKAIVIGKSGLKIKTIGQRSRKDIERFLKCKIMLKLFVNVKLNLSKKNIFLNEFINF